MSKSKRARQVRNQQRAKAGRDAYMAGRGLTIIEQHTASAPAPFQAGAMPVVMAQLPPAAAGFTGRDNELQALVELLGPSGGKRAQSICY